MSAVTALGLGVASGFVAANAAVAASSLAGPILDHPQSPVWPKDAPDPDVVEFGSTFYAYTTGNAWGNHIGLLKSKSPVSGWHTVTSGPFGSTAVPTGPSFLYPNLLTSPTVAKIGSRYVMFFDGQLRSVAGLYCLAVATSASPTGPFVDTSHHFFGPCAASYNGSIDPDLVAGPDGRYWLLWKENDSGPYTSAQIFSQELSTSGTALVGKSHVLLTQDSGTFRWESTVENPALTYAGGTWWLLFSAGLWTNSSYSEAMVKCAGPDGPCGTDPGQILTSYGPVHGPGGATAFEDRLGVWYLDFAAWTGACTGQGGTCGRELYVTPIEFSLLTVTTTSLPTGKVGQGYRGALAADGGLGTRTWRSSALPKGLRLNPATGEVLGTPRRAGSKRVVFTVSTGAVKHGQTITVTVKS